MPPKKKIEEAPLNPPPPGEGREGETDAAYIVVAPLRHDGEKYAPGDPLAPGVIPDDVAALLLADQVIRKP